MIGDVRVVFESSNRRACTDRALVLESLGIPYEIIADDDTSAIIVAAEHSARASEELRLYEAENPARPIPRRTPYSYLNPVPGLVIYAVVLTTIAWLAGESAFGRDWLAAGRVDGILVRNGEWWRTITALTLHADLKHLVGNLVFGALFGLFAGRLLGSGCAWLSIVLTGALGNALNTLLLESTHRAIGASTAVFAALGLVAGFVWRGRLMAQDRWSLRYGPIVGGLALLMYTGTGDENTDIGAHLMGFVTGFAGGVLLPQVIDHLRARNIQMYLGAAALLLVTIAWALAL